MRLKNSKPENGIALMNILNHETKINKNISLWKHKKNFLKEISECFWKQTIPNKKTETNNKHDIWFPK